MQLLKRFPSRKDSSISHPIGSFLVKVRLRLGLAWLIGMVLPYDQRIKS